MGLFKYPPIYSSIVFIAETDEILADSSITGAEVKNHDGNSGLVATGSMRKSIVLTNGAGNTTHEANTASGMFIIK